MLLEEFNILRQSAQGQGVIFYYSGYFSQNIIAAMGDVLKYKMETQAPKTATVRRVFSTFVEMAQNIIHYSPDEPVSLPPKEPNNGSLRYGAMAVGKRDDRFFIVCGNRVKKSSVERLTKKLDAIRTMSSEEIKLAYKHQLQSTDNDPESKGVGLGFLTVARDSVDPIEYSFVPFPENYDQYAYFYIKASIL